MYQDTQFRLAPAPQHEDEDDDMMVLYPMSSKDKVCERCGGHGRPVETRDNSAQASIERVHASTISTETSSSSSRRKKGNDMETIGKYIPFLTEHKLLTLCKAL